MAILLLLGLLEYEEKMGRRELADRQGDEHGERESTTR
jgi:hypothetical protein